MALESTTDQIITEEGAKLLIDIITGENAEQIVEHKVGEGTVTDRRNQTSLASPSSLNDLFTGHSVTYDTTNQIVKITSTMEIEDGNTSALDNISELGVFTDAGTMLQYLEIDIDTSQLS